MSVKGLRTKRTNQKGGLFFLAGLIPAAIAAAKAAAIPLAISAAAAAKASAIPLAIGAAKAIATGGLGAIAGHLAKQKLSGSGYSIPEIIQNLKISKKDLPRTAFAIIKRAEELINKAKQDDKYKIALEVGKALRPIFEPIVLNKLRQHGIMLGSGIKLAGGSFEHELASRVVLDQPPGLVGSGLPWLGLPQNRDHPYAIGMRKAYANNY